MRQLSKIKLQDAVVLGNSEMKMIYGGSGGDDTCSLHCKDGSVFSVTSCKSSTACNNHGGKLNCNGPSNAACLN